VAGRGGSGVGVQPVSTGRLPGVMLAVIVLTPLAAFEIVNGLPAAAQSLERVRRSAARVFDVVDTAPLVANWNPKASNNGPFGFQFDEQPSLRIRGLRVRYVDGGPWVLDGLDLDLAANRHVAITGPSGGGKSTLAAALLRFIPYAQGSVTLDGVELSALDGDDVRRVIGLVEQEPHVFNSSVRENLRLARPDATDTELYEALQHARLAAWVD